MLFKKSGQDLQDPVTPSNNKNLSSLCASREMIGAVNGASKFSTINCLLALREKVVTNKKTDDFNDAKLKVITKDLKRPDCCLIICAKYKVPRFLTHMLCCNPPYPLKKYDQYSQSFSIRHVLSCRRGGLVIAHRNEVRDEILYLAWQAFPSDCVRGKTLIH